MDGTEIAPGMRYCLQFFKRTPGEMCDGGSKVLLHTEMKCSICLSFQKGQKCPQKLKSVRPGSTKDMTAYHRVLLKLDTAHPTSQNSRDCQTHVWSGPMGEHVT